MSSRAARAAWPGEERASPRAEPATGEEGGMGLSAGEDGADGAGASSGPEGLLPGQDEQAAQGEFLEGSSPAAKSAWAVTSACRASQTWSCRP